MLATPQLIGLSLVALDAEHRAPGLFIAMILQAAAPVVGKGEIHLDAAIRRVQLLGITIRVQGAIIIA